MMEESKVLNATPDSKFNISHASTLPKASATTNNLTSSSKTKQKKSAYRERLDRERTIRKLTWKNYTFEQVVAWIRDGVWQERGLQNHADMRVRDHVQDVVFLKEQFAALKVSFMRMDHTLVTLGGFGNLAYLTLHSIDPYRFLAEYALHSLAYEDTSAIDTSTFVSVLTKATVQSTNSSTTKDTIAAASLSQSSGNDMNLPASKEKIAVDVDDSNVTDTCETTDTDVHGICTTSIEMPITTSVNVPTLSTTETTSILHTNVPTDVAPLNTDADHPNDMTFPHDCANASTHLEPHLHDLQLAASIKDTKSATLKDGDMPKFVPEDSTFTPKYHFMRPESRIYTHSTSSTNDESRNILL